MQIFVRKQIEEKISEIDINFIEKKKTIKSIMTIAYVRINTFYFGLTFCPSTAKIKKKSKIK